MHMSVYTTIITKAWRLRHEDPARLALQLQKQSGLTPEDRQFLIRQVKGRQVVARKLPRWAANPDVLFPPAQNLEQSSSESTAAYKATLLAGALLVDASSPGASSHGIPLHGSSSPGHHSEENGEQPKPDQAQNPIIKTLVDLTGGFGVDSAFFARHFGHIIHVEPDADLQAIAAHNCRQMGISNVTFQNTTAEEWLHQPEQSVPGILHDTKVETPFGTTPEVPFETTPETTPGTIFDAIYIDPSRRPGTAPPRQTRVSTLEDSLPNVLALLPIMCKLARHILIKASPMISIPETIRQLNGILGARQCGILREVHIVSVQNECKEVLFRVDGRGIQGRTDGTDRSHAMGQANDAHLTDGADRSGRVADVSSIPQEPRMVAVNLDSGEASDEAPGGSEFVFWPREEAEAGASVVYADPEILFEWGKPVQDKETGSNDERSIDGNIEASDDSNAGQYYLFEPNASIMKSGAFNLVATRYGLQKVAPNTHLYVCLARAGVIVENPGSTASNTERGSEDGQSIRVSELPGRLMQVYRVLPYQQALLREVLQKELGINRAQIATRNFPETEVQVRKKTGLKQAGHHAPAEHGWAGVHRLIACRLSNDRLAVFTGESASMSEGASEGASKGASATQLKGQDSKE